MHHSVPAIPFSSKTKSQCIIIMSDTSSCSSPVSSNASLSTPPSTPPNLYQNCTSPGAKWVVQKFGGTSIGKYAVKIAGDIISDYIVSNKVAVVCSARSGSTKSAGTTSLLLRAASEAVGKTRSTSKLLGKKLGGEPLTGLFGQSATTPSTPGTSTPLSRPFLWENISGSSTPNEFTSTIDIIRQEHLDAASEAIQDIDIRLELEDEITRDCDWLKSFLFASQVIDEISPRSKDIIVGLGERLACKFMTAVLRDQGVDAEYVSLEDVVPDIEEDLDSEASLGQDFYDRVAVAVGERIKQCGARVPVVTGFFGPVPGTLLKQVGRGYTDLLSGLLAVGLEASELQIWKEVDGVFTADPRKVPTARVIPMISPDEAAELTYYGSEVVHPFAMEQAIRRSIPIRIKNVENPSGHGTVIHPDLEHLEPKDETSDSPVRVHPVDDRSNKLPSAVTIKEHILVININSNRKSVSHGFLAGIFGTLDRFGVKVDLISTSEVQVSMAIEIDRFSNKVLDRLVGEMGKHGSVTVHRDMAILSLVGQHMRQLVGVAGRMFTTLGQRGVNIEMISQGASEINISCVVEGKDAVKALNLIHHSCLQISSMGVGRAGSRLF
ncbi:aspartate kinase [Moniliophthora roreri]|nr:aspartate kinase [Moniliophthora roreri]